MKLNETFMLNIPGRHEPDEPTIGFNAQDAAERFLEINPELFQLDMDGGSVYVVCRDDRFGDMVLRVDYAVTVEVQGAEYLSQSEACEIIYWE